MILTVDYDMIVTMMLTVDSDSDYDMIVTMRVAIRY